MRPTATWSCRHPGRGTAWHPDQTPSSALRASGVIPPARSAASVTDRSGLALDPELASYYLMSATLMRAPEVIRRTGELRGLAASALRALARASSR